MTTTSQIGSDGGSNGGLLKAIGVDDPVLELPPQRLPWLSCR